MAAEIAHIDIRHNSTRSPRSPERYRCDWRVWNPDTGESESGTMLCDRPWHLLRQASEAAMRACKRLDQDPTQ